MDMRSAPSGTAFAGRWQQRHGQPKNVQPVLDYIVQSWLRRWRAVAQRPAARSDHARGAGDVVVIEPERLGVLVGLGRCVWLGGPPDVPAALAGAHHPAARDR